MKQVIVAYRHETGDVRTEHDMRQETLNTVGDKRIVNFVKKMFWARII